MLRPTAINVYPLPDYMLRVMFDNGETRVFDVKPYIKGEWFGQLKDTSIFSSVKANGFTVEWCDGQDICPDDLYYQSIPLRN